MASRRSAAAIDAIAEALGAIGRLPVHRALAATGAGAGFQADQANSAHQVANVWDRVSVDQSVVDGNVPAGPVLLIDDEVDSRWTITVAAFRLSQAGLGPVLPFALRSR